MHVSERVSVGEEKKRGWTTDEEKDLDIENAFVINDDSYIVSSNDIQ